MSALVLAHAGDWLVSMIYMAPVVVLVTALVVIRRRDERHGEEPDATAWDDDDDGIEYGDDLSPR